jgi:hypothetical protein
LALGTELRYDNADGKVVHRLRSSDLDGSNRGDAYIADDRSRFGGRIAAAYRSQMNALCRSYKPTHGDH